MEKGLLSPLADIENRVCDIVASQFRLKREEINPHLRLFTDLHIDSLEIVELMMAIEDEFGVSLPDGIEGDMAYKSVFTRKDFHLSDFAELVYFRQGIEPPTHRKFFRAAPPKATTTKVSFTQLGGSLKASHFKSGELLECLGKTSSGYPAYHGPGVRSERGGSWVGPAYLCRSSYRRGRVPHAKGRCLGFRCVSNFVN